MNSKQIIAPFTSALLYIALSHTSTADVLELTDKEVWIDVVGKFTTIDFTGFEDGTFITDQYADFGLLFTDGNDNIHHTCSYVNDCRGLDGNQAIDLVFDTPQTYIAVDHPGSVQFELFNKGKLVYTSSSMGLGGSGHFSGLVLTQPFDAAILSRESKGSQVFIDDLHFGYLPPGDINQDGIVGTADLLILFEVWGDVCPGACPSDITGDDETNTEDMLALLASWGFCDNCDLPGECPGDADNNCMINTADLLNLFNSWGDCPDHVFIPCQGDINFDGQVNTDDLLLLFDNWG